MLVAAAAMAFFACQKQEDNAPEEVKNVTLTFSSEKPSFVDEAKTQWNGSSIVWSAGDKISVAYTVEGEWMGYMPEESTTASAPKLYKSEALTASSPTAKFNVSGNFNLTAEGTHVFYGVYPAISSTSFDDAPVATVTIPSLQTPKTSSFDSSADIMTGVSVGEFNSLPKPEDEISMMWTRLVAHADITLTSVNGIAADEKIFSITLTAQEDANLVGKQKVNLLTNEVNKAVASAKTNQVQINGGNLSVADGNVEFWACILPATLTSLKVELDTDKATYTREITNISKTFKQNARNTLSIKMDGATRVEKAAETWKLVTPAEGITEGTYAFVAKTSTKTGVLISSNGTGSAPTYYTSGISIENDCLIGVSDAMQFDIAGEAGNYVIYVTGGTSTWLYCNNKNDGIRVGTGPDKTWTIVAHPKNSSVFEIKNNGKSRYLGVYNNQDWRSYDSSDATNFTNATGSSQIYLYKKTSGSVAPDTTPKLEVEKTEIELTSGGGEGTVEVTAVNVSSPQVRALAEAGSQDEVTWLSVEYDENGTLSYAAEANGSENSREADIEIYAEDLEGNPLTKYIHVTQAGKVDTNFEPGKYWLFGTKNEETMVMLPIVDKDFGYPNGDEVTESRSYEKNAFTFEAEAGGYTIQDTYGKYYYQKANGSSYYNTFNVSATKPTSGHIWTVSIQNDGAAVITNIASGKVVKFADGTYKTFGVYGADEGTTTDPGVLPVLVKAENPLTVELSSIAVSGQTTVYTVGDEFEFDGVVTATYTDGSTKAVSPTDVSDPDMSVAGTSEVTVTYTEDGITKEDTYSITVNAAQSGGGAEETVLYETAFNYAISGSAYNSATEIEGKDASGTSWGIVYGNWNSSNCAQMRVYTAAKFGSVYMKFDVARATRVTYKAKVSNAALKLNTYYSIDGGSTWTKVDASKAISTTTLTEYNFVVSQTGEFSKVRIKFEATGTAPTSSNYQLTIDDVTIYGIASEGGTVEPDPEEPSTGVSKTAEITFGNNGVKINDASVTGTDSENNNWTITTVGTTSYTSSSSYYQVGSSSKPATSITFTTTLPSTASVSGIEAKFGGFSGTAGDVTLKVGDTSVGTGKLNATSDVIVESNSTASGNKVTVTITNIAKGVKCYYISVNYTE